MADWKSALAALGATEEANENKELMEQREQSQARLNSAESRQKKTEGQKNDIDRKKRVGVVYSTNPDYAYSDDSEEEAVTLPKNQQKLRLSIERAGRGGKTVTLIKGFVGSEEDINALCKLLKQKCGVGGSVKDGEPKVDGRRESQIIIQGDHRQRLVEILKKEGYTQTK